MTYLSSNQLQQYKDEGFVSPIDIFSKDKAKEIRDEIESIEQRLPGESRRRRDTSSGVSSRTCTNK